ncbi:hypothetical protein [Kitasatospora kifunensis]|uniref:hypothetical protein n=1 Tax=Kitasatospora kifunensis TaxID=58351 RepID=UPI00160DB843|nr:hypothetical protein [Kitasatospora kifunensis]
MIVETDHRPVGPAHRARPTDAVRQLEEPASGGLGDRDLQFYLAALPVEAQLQLERVVQLALQFLGHLGQASAELGDGFEQAHVLWPVTSFLLRLKVLQLLAQRLGSLLEFLVARFDLLAEPCGQLRVVVIVGIRELPDEAALSLLVVRDRLLQRGSWPARPGVP